MKDEYIRKQDAVSIIEKEMKNYVSDIWYKSATHSALNDVSENIKSLEPADVVPVVRCRDCKHWKSYWGRCYKHDEYGMASDDFCSYGEKREE